MKKLFAVLIALAIIFTMIPTAVFANEQQTSDPSADVETVSAPVDDQTDQIPAETAEEPIFDVIAGSDCICGGKHVDEDHTCAAVTWESLSNANVGTYFASAKVMANHNFRLTEDVTATKVYYIGEGYTLNLDLNGHTLTVDNGSGGIRAINVYAGATLNICDSSAAGTGVLKTTRAPATASIIACFGQVVTEENPNVVNLWGGTFTNTGTPSVPALLANTDNTHVTVYSGVTFKDIKNNSTGAGVASGVIVLGGSTTGTGNTLTFNGGTIKDCTLKCSGGALALYAGTTTINDIQIENVNVGTKLGGGIYMASLVSSGSYKFVPKLVMNGGTITKCTAGNGGGIYIQDGDFTMNGGTISENKATGLIASDSSANSYGGGIYYKPTNKLDDGRCTLNGGYITNNVASGMGGGIRINSNGCVINGTIISGNTAQGADGGGVYLTGTTTEATMTAGAITGNHSSSSATGGFQAAGVGIRNQCTFNVSGNSRIYGNTGTGNNTYNLDFGFAGNGLRHINIGELTGDGYVVLNLGTSAKMALTESEANNIDTSTSGIKIYSVKHDTPLAEGDVEIQAVPVASEYLGGTDVSLTLQAKLTDACELTEAYVTKITASATAEHFSVAETTVHDKSNGTLKLNKAAWVTVGTLTAESEFVTESCPDETVAVSAKILAEAAEAEEFEVSCDTAINLKYDPDAHMHCTCGQKNGCIYEGHESQTAVYKKITQTNVSELSGKTFNGPKDYYFFLDEDITITTNITIGAKGGIPVNFYLCLNGHTVTVTGNRMFDFRNGQATVCDCVGTGVIQSKAASATTLSNGCIAFWQRTQYAEGNATLNMYGGTLQYADDAAKTSTHGLMYVQGQGHINMYGVTVDGKNKGNTPNSNGGGANGITIMDGSLNMTDCVLKNCYSTYASVADASSGRGGALKLGGSTASATITDCLFEDNTADVDGGAIYATGAAGMTLAGNTRFVNNKVGNEANDICLNSNRALSFDNHTSTDKIRVKFLNTGVYGSVSAADFSKLIVSGAEDLAIELQNGKIMVSKYTTDHPHCYCGGSCEVGNHSHVQKTKWVELSSASQISGKDITSETWYYLTADITVSTNIGIRDGAILRICLNGHTITSTSTRLFNYYDGTVTICDCSEHQTGAILFNPSASSDAAGVLLFCQNQSAAHHGGMFELYGGTLAYASKNAIAGKQGMIYASSYSDYDGMQVNIYGGTIDGANNDAINSSQAGAIVLVRGGINMYGGTIKNCASRAAGGAIYIYKGTFNMYDGEIINNQAKNQGGAIYAQGISTLNFYGGSVSNNKSGANGAGAIYATGGNANLNIHGGVFENNKTDGKSGGCIRFSGSTSKASKFVMDGGEIRNCRVGFTPKEGYGGGVWVSNAVFVMKGGVIDGCAAYSMGGGVYAGGKTTTIRIEGGSIRNCTADDIGGGGVCCNRAQFTMTGGAIEYNTARCLYLNKTGGGGVLIQWDQGLKKEYFNDWQTVQFLGGVIRGNRCENRMGGGVYVKHSKVTIDGTVFEDNYGEGDGGGGYCAGSTTYTYIKSGIFRNNESLKAGAGALINGGSFLDVDYAEFLGNYAGTIGAGLCMYNVEAPHIKNILCAGNVAKSSGGGLYLRARYQPGTIDYMTLRDNQGSSGAGMYLYYGATINNCHVFNNKTTTGSGAGLYAAAATEMIVNKGIIEDNYAGGSGGGIYCSEKTDIKNTVIRNNTAKNYGGGIYQNFGSKNAFLHLNLNEGTEIYNNTAKYGGALGVRGNYNHATINGAQIYGNKATADGGAIYNRIEAYLTVLDGKIYDNEAAGNGGAIYAHGRVELYGGEITGNKAGGVGGAAYFDDTDNDTESYQHNVFILGSAKVTGNKAKTANGIYLTPTAASLIKDGVLLDAVMDITLSTDNDITKTVQGAYNYQKIGDKTYRLTEASNALRPSEVDANGKVITVGEVVSVDSIKKKAELEKNKSGQRLVEREEDEDPETDEEVVEVVVVNDDTTTVGNA